MDTDLHQIVSSKQELSDDHVQYFLYQLLAGVAHLHAANAGKRVILQRARDGRRARPGPARPPRACTWYSRLRRDHSHGSAAWATESLSRRHATRLGPLSMSRLCVPYQRTGRAQ